MKTYIIDNGSALIHPLISLFDAIDPTVIGYGELSKVSIEPDSLVILSGGHTIPVLWHDKEFHHEIELINNHDGPIIGICLGMQLIAHAHGSSLRHLEYSVEGIKKIIPTVKAGAILEKPTYRVFEHHQWSVPSAKLPLEALATSIYGVEILRHVSKPQYGFQFHPESTEGLDGRELLQSILELVVPEVTI